LLFTTHLRSSGSWCDLVVETLPMSAADRSCCQCHGSDAALKAQDHSLTFWPPSRLRDQRFLPKHAPLGQRDQWRQKSS
jgi:hypothetical protein